MPDSSSLYEVTSLFTNVESRRRFVLSSLLSFTDERVTLTFRVPDRPETYTITVDATCEEVAPLRAAIRQAYHDAPTG